MNKQEILLDIKAHQRDINQCTGDLVKARIFPNKCKEMNAYARMESLLAKTNQMCSVIIDYLTQSEHNAVKPKFKVGQYVIYKNEYFYIYNVENGYYFLVGTGEITHVELPVEHEDELTLILDNALVSARIGTNIVPQDSFGGLLNELFMDFPKVPFSDMLRIVLRTQEYIESQQPKQALPKWRETYNKSNWSGEISVSPMERLFRYENYTINADELFNKLEKEE